MSYGLNLSASGALTSMYRLDALTNNLANVNTVGFKPHTPYTRQRDAARIEDNLGRVDSDPLLERLGGGVQLAPTLIDFTQGSLRQTGNQLDVAFDGDGFLAVRGDSSGDTTVLNLTRDGRLSLDSTGKLVMSSSGRPVLDIADQPIRLERDAEVLIGTDGTISQSGRRVAQLKLVDVADHSRLRKVGQGLFAMTNDAIESLHPASGRLKQGHVEGSAVNEISTLMKVQAAAGDVRANLAMISYHDRLMDRAINRLGRVA
ncbi:MAG TPA: flagellar hook basal-body protein [Phycisphaerales bacterium]|nr:flagellar hook basal-body protein [Phycisphaerales bacterium]